METLLQQLAGGKFGQVFGDVDAAGFEFKQFHRFALLAGAEDEAEGLLFPFLSFMAVEPAQIEFNLPGIGGLEVADLEFDDHQPPQSPMVEEQIDVVVVSIEGNALLPLDKREPTAEFEQERFEVPDEGPILIAGPGRFAIERLLPLPKSAQTGRPVVVLE